MSVSNHRSDEARRKFAREIAEEIARKPDADVRALLDAGDTGIRCSPDPQEEREKEAQRVAQIAAKLFPSIEGGCSFPCGSPDAVREQVRQAREILAEARRQVGAAQPIPELRPFTAD